MGEGNDTGRKHQPALLSYYPPPRLQAIWRRLSLSGRPVSKPNEYRALLAEAERLLADSTNDAIRDRIELRDAVCAYLEAEKQRGVPLTAILESIEGILIHAAGRLGQIDGYQKFAQQLIDWCVELYGPNGQKSI